MDGSSTDGLLAAYFYEKKTENPSVSSVGERDLNRGCECKSHTDGGTKRPESIKTHASLLKENHDAKNTYYFGQNRCL